MGGYRLGLLVFINQNFTSRFIFLMSAYKFEYPEGCMLVVEPNFIIIGLILSWGR
jgi:hypothetical protein